MSPKERARYQVYIAGVFVAASVAGPLLGGFLAQHLHWSFIFWINLPIGFAAFWLTNDKLRLLPRHERRHRLDWPGASLLVLGSTSLLLALSWGGVRFPWGSTVVLSLLAAALVLSAGFAARLATASTLPVMLDSTEPPVVEAGLECLGGRAVINSVNFEDGEGPADREPGGAFGVGVEERGRGVHA